MVTFLCVLCGKRVALTCGEKVTCDLCIFYFRNCNYRAYVYKMCWKTHVRWVPVTTAWRVLGLQLEEWPPAMEAANILNKQPLSNDKRWSSSLGVGSGANNPSP
jgi:hypothetical protein